MKPRLRINLGDKYGRADNCQPPVPFGYGRKRIPCKCECGVFRDVERTALVTGETQSCGCFKKEVLHKRNTTHGRSGGGAHRTWKAMLSRCKNMNALNYKYYGGRGITVCERWESFENFFKDMGERPEGASLDRINNAKGYSKENCRWVDRKAQQNNTRATILVTLRGETFSLMAAIEKFRPPLSYNGVKNRILSGWDHHEAFTKPPQGSTQ